MATASLPAERPRQADTGGAKRPGAGGGPNGAAFPWQEDTTRTSAGSRRLGWVPPEISIGFTDSLAHEVLLIVKPSVGRAVAVWTPFEGPLQKMREQRAAALVDPSTGKLVDPVTGELVNHSDWSRLSAEDQLEDCTRRANQRATSGMRDYMVHNRLVKMWVLTFAGDGLHGPEGRREAMRRTATFVRSLRRKFFGGKAFPYVFSPELHPDGHGWHVNLFLDRRYIAKNSFQRAWGHGNVWFTDFQDHKRDWLGRRIGQDRARATGGAARAARVAASYGAKYAQKDWATEAIGDNAHRYERSEGFNVPEIRLRVRTFADAARALMNHPAFGTLHSFFEVSQDTPGWFGPPIRGWCFDPPRRPAPADLGRALNGLPSGVKGSMNEHARGTLRAHASALDDLTPPLDAAVIT